MLTRPLRHMALPAAALAATLVSCGPVIVEDPIAELRTPGSYPSRQLAAMSMLDAEGADEAYLDALERVLWQNGYTTQVREAALDRLDRHAPERLQRSIRLRLPNLGAYGWLERLSAIIVERGWVEQTPALISSWARVADHVEFEDRPEYEALVAMHGRDRIVDVVYATFRDTSSASSQRLREKCWELLHRLGERERLVALVTSQPPAPDDLLMVDLYAGADELGIIPYNREEIVWLRTLRQPQHAEFWSRARAARSMLAEDAARSLELRDLGAVVSASIHEPELLRRTTGELFDRIYAHTRAQKHYVHHSSFTGDTGSKSASLPAWRGELTWGDLLALLMAVRAVQVPEVVDHFFDFADRDMADGTTEYGGVLTLDDLGRFELLEFAPTLRRNDRTYIPPRGMYEAAYTAVFHVHLHAQEHRNSQYAGPGYGDLGTADASRANHLVLTFVARDAMNVDFYRHGRVVVDLGEIRRP